MPVLGVFLPLISFTLLGPKHTIEIILLGPKHTIEITLLEPITSIYWHQNTQNITLLGPERTKYHFFGTWAHNITFLGPEHTKYHFSGTWAHKISLFWNPNTSIFWDQNNKISLFWDINTSIFWDLNTQNIFPGLSTKKAQKKKIFWAPLYLC